MCNPRLMPPAGHCLPQEPQLPRTTEIKVGDVVPYRNTHSKIKLAKVESLEPVGNGKTWFNGTDTVTGAKVWYPCHLSLEFINDGVKPE